MGRQKMLINVYEEETRIALMEDSLLVGLHFQQTNRERTAGNIYRGTVVKVNPAFQAAFVDYGEKRNGFLSISDLNLQLFKGGNGERGRPRIQSLLRAGQVVMVQVLKEGMREKGAALTTNISLPGRYLVYTPNSERSGVSRKIADTDKRHALRDVLQSLLGEDGGGVIIRTAGIDRPAADLKKDLATLRKEWKAIQERFTKLGRAGQVHQEPSSIVRVLRDYFTEDVEEVWVDSPDAYQEALLYIKANLPKFQKRLKLYVEDTSLFAAHNVEEQLEALGTSRVPLKSGGSVVIESTEAMVAIDVNSGKSNQESDIEDTALRTNLEAAQEVARQLRLRNLGGLIVVDFIDMVSAKNRSKVVQAMTEALKYDKARTTVGSISQFGLLELSRQRIDMELSLGLRTRCTICNGTGFVPTLQAAANSLLRKIRGLAAEGRYAEIHADLPMELANYMLNSKRESLRDLEMEFEIRIHLFGDPHLPNGAPVELKGKLPLGAPAAQGAERPAAQAVERHAPARAERATPEAAEAQPGERTGRRRRRRRGRGRRGEQPEATLAAAPSTEESLEESQYEEDSSAENLAAEEAEEFEELEPGQADQGWEADTQAGQPEDEEEDEGEGAGEEEVPLRQPLAEAVPMALVPLGEDGGNGSGAYDLPAGTVAFSSQHLVTRPDAEIVPLLQRRRSNPLHERALHAAAGEALFESTHRHAAGGATEAAPEQALPAAPVQPGQHPSRRRGRGRGHSAEAPGAEAALEADVETSGNEALPVELDAPEGEPGPGNEKEPQPGNEKGGQPGGARRRRRRRPARGNQGGPPHASAAGE